jgi:hypothetical protein
LGWKYSADKQRLIDEFEKERSLRRCSTTSNFQLTRDEREQMLLEWGTSFQEIVEAVRVNLKVKHQRRRTVNSLGTYDRLEELMENTTRKIRQSLSMGKRYNKHNIDVPCPSSDSDGSRSDTSPPIYLAVDSSETLTVSTSIVEMTEERSGGEDEAMPTDEITNCKANQQAKGGSGVDKPLSMPRRSSSPISLRTAYQSALETNPNELLPLPALESQHTMFDENNHLSFSNDMQALLGLSLVASADFDISITSYDTRGETCLALSFEQPIDSFFNGNGHSNEQEKKGPAMNVEGAASTHEITSRNAPPFVESTSETHRSNTLYDDETTISKSFSRSNVHLSNSNLTPKDANVEENQSFSALDDKTTIATRYFNNDKPTTQCPVTASIEDDDETSIDSQYMDLLDKSYLSSKHMFPKQFDGNDQSCQPSLQTTKPSMHQESGKSTAATEQIHGKEGQEPNELAPVPHAYMTSEAISKQPVQSESVTISLQKESTNLENKGTDRSESATATTSTTTVTTNVTTTLTNNTQTKKTSSRRRRYVVSPYEVTELIEL